MTQEKERIIDKAWDFKAMIMTLLSTLIVATFAFLWHTNSRIAVLEIQMAQEKSDRKELEGDMKEIRNHLHTLNVNQQRILEALER